MPASKRRRMKSGNSRAASSGWGLATGKKTQQSSKFFAGAATASMLSRGWVSHSSKASTFPHPSLPNTKARRNALARKLSRKIDALSIMTENERDTYQQWLSQPDAIMALFRRNFQICKSTVGWGKLTLIASPNI